MGDFGSFLKAKRLKRGLGMRSFGLSHAAISKFESGRHKPTYQSLIEIAKGFGMPTWKLIKEFETCGRNS